jgi:hypothetical protein
MGWIEDNELRPEVQKLVDRFGQAQTFEILMALAHSVCPDGANKISGSLCAWEGCERVFDRRTLPEDWALLTLYQSKRPIRNFLDLPKEALLRDAFLCPDHTKQLDDQLKDIGRALSDRDGMMLVEETPSYLDGTGSSDSKKLERSAALVYATESMRPTTRLTQLASWLLLHRAVMPAESANRCRKKVSISPSRPIRAGLELDSVVGISLTIFRLNRMVIEAMSRLLHQVVVRTPSEDRYERSRQVRKMMAVAMEPFDRVCAIRVWFRRILEQQGIMLGECKKFLFIASALLKIMPHEKEVSAWHEKIAALEAENHKLRDQARGSIFTAQDTAADLAGLIVRSISKTKFEDMVKRARVLYKEEKKAAPKTAAQKKKQEPAEPKTIELAITQPEPTSRTVSIITNDADTVASAEARKKAGYGHERKEGTQIADEALTAISSTDVPST